MKGKKRIIFIANLVLVIGIFNWLILQKEYTLMNGELVLLKIYPLDPMSLMQGKYMTLGYEMTRQWNRDKDKNPSNGYCILRKRQGNFADYDRLQANKTPLFNDEVAIKYTLGDGILRIGAESFLFEQGQEATYERAEYAGLRVESSGAIVLEGLYDKEGKKILNNYVVEN